MVKTKFNAKEKIGKYKKVYVPSSLGSTFKPELVNNLSSYCSLIGIDRTKFISEVLSEKLAGLILTKDFITLEEPFYFNWQELEEKGIVKATTEEPIQDLDKCYLVKKVPNNFDSFSNGAKTYCFKNNKDLHRGIYFYPKPVFYKSSYTFRELLVYPLYFNYNIEANTLDISLIKINELDNYINFKELAEEDIFSDLKNYLENLIDNEGNLNFKTWASVYHIIEPYSSVKSVEDSIATNTGLVKEALKYNPNAEITSSTSEDLLNYLSVAFKKSRNERKKNLKLQQEIKENCFLEWFYNPEEKYIDYSKFVNVEFKEEPDK